MGMAGPAITGPVVTGPAAGGWGLGGRGARPIGVHPVPSSSPACASQCTKNGFTPIPPASLDGLLIAPRAELRVPQRMGLQRSF